MWALGVVASLCSPRFRGFKRRLLSSLRAAVYLSVMGVVTLGLLSTRANAKLREQSVSLSQQLLPLADLLDDATALRLNGELIHFSMTVVPSTSVKQVLDRVQAQCEKQPGPLAQQSLALIRHLPESLPGAAAAAELLSKLVVTREENERQGAIVCFTGDGSAARPSFAEDFAATRDLGALGNLRYVMAGQGRPEQNEAHLTRVISLWTEGELRLDRLTPPASGDAPGSDSSLIPRPPRAQRVFSAAAVGAPYSVRIYQTEAGPEEVLAFYDTTMSAFRQLTMSGYEQTGRAYVKDAQPLLLHLTRDGDKTVVTLSELGAAADLETVTRVEP
jgi:hypothetical protein